MVGTGDSLIQSCIRTENLFFIVSSCNNLFKLKGEKDEKGCLHCHLFLKDTAAIPRTAVSILLAKVRPPALRRHPLQCRLCQQYAIGAIGAEVLVMDGKKKTNKCRYSFSACIGVDSLWRNNTLFLLGHQIQRMTP